MLDKKRAVQDSLPSRVPQSFVCRGGGTSLLAGGVGEFPAQRLAGLAVGDCFDYEGNVDGAKVTSNEAWDAAVIEWELLSSV